jgi:TPR repeat protein
MSAGRRCPSSRLSSFTVVLVAIGCVCASAQSDERIPATVVKIVGPGFSVGTGVVIAVDEGVATVVTAFHVIEGDDPFQVVFVAASDQPPLAVNRADVFGAQRQDQDHGLAVFRVRGIPRGVEPAVFESGPALARGADVAYWGFPGGANSLLRIAGTVSGHDGALLIMSPPVDPGASGGPVTRNGRVVGIMMARNPSFAHAMIAEVATATLKGWTAPFTTAAADPIPGPLAGDVSKATNEELDAGCSSGHIAACYELGSRYSASGAAMNHAMAVSLFQRSCEGGDARGCTDLARMYDTGRGAMRDVDQAVALFRKGCEGGDPRGCSDLGWMYAEGRGVAGDDAQAIALYRRGCDGGDPRGCDDLGWMHERGRGVARDDAQAAALYEHSCAAGSARGCTESGRMHDLGRGVVRDAARAYTLFQRGCEGGDAPGCTYWGNMVGDRETAITLFQRGCEGGHGAGCTNWGRSFEQQDRVQALRLYERGCREGDPQGCTLSARLHDAGGGGVRRDREAAFWAYTQACNLEDGQACTRVGHRHKDGEGVDRDLELARRYYERGCDRDDPWGCFYAGELYELGRGVARDRARALDLYRRACAERNPAACEKLKRLGG